MQSNKYKHITDAELLERHVKSDHNEWIGILLERYTLLLFGVSMKYLKNEQEAHDCVQQVFLKVIQDVHKYKIEFFKSWLFMVAKNHCLTILRHKKQVNGMPDFFEIEDERNEIEIDLKKIEQVRLDVLKESLNELNEDQKKCIILFYLEKKSYNEIVAQTPYSLLQVKSFIQNGKRNLKISILKKTETIK